MAKPQREEYPPGMQRAIAEAERTAATGNTQIGNDLEVRRRLAANERTVSRGRAPDDVRTYFDRGGILTAPIIVEKPIAIGTMVAPAYRSDLERRYADEVLEPSRLAGEILGWWYESFTFNLGGKAGTRKAVKYKIDFLVLPTSREIEIRETKGYWRRGEREHLKLVAAMFPFIVKAIEWDKDRECWTEERF